MKCGDRYAAWLGIRRHLTPPSSIDLCCTQTPEEAASQSLQLPQEALLPREAGLFHRRTKTKGHISTALIMDWNVSARNELQAGQGLPTVVRYFIKFRHAAANAPGCLPPLVMAAPGHVTSGAVSLTTRTVIYVRLWLSPRVSHCSCP